MYLLLNHLAHNLGTACIAPDSFSGLKRTDAKQLEVNVLLPRKEKFSRLTKSSAEWKRAGEKRREKRRQEKRPVSLALLTQYQAGPIIHCPVVAEVLTTLG